MSKRKFNPLCGKCGIPMRKKQRTTQGERRFFCPKCGAEK